MSDKTIEYLGHVYPPWQPERLEELIGCARNSVGYNAVPFICHQCKYAYLHYWKDDESYDLSDTIVLICKFCDAKNDCVQVSETIIATNDYMGNEFKGSEITIFLVPRVNQRAKLPNDFLVACDNDSDLRKVEQLFIESQLVLALSPRACCVLLRVAMEGLVEYILDQKKIDHSKKRSFAGKIDLLHEHDPPTPLDSEFWETLRALGNDAAHWKTRLQGSTPEKAKSLTGGFKDLVDQYVVRNPRKANTVNKHPLNPLSK